jgi:amino acid adenylation domain-containing protein
MPASSQTIVSCFAAQVAQRPDQIAVLANDSTWTFAQLDSAAKNASHHLTARGIGPGDRVALLMPHSAPTLALMLGILRAGAAFVPLDPGYPATQLAAIVADCRPACIIADHARLPPHRPWTVPEIDPTTFLVPAPEAPASTVEPNDPAYVMYTSGSTGQPKGVVIPHRAVIRLVIDPNYVSFIPNDVVLHLAPLAFDASTFEIWGALLNGARLAIVGIQNPTLNDIGAAISRFGVSIAWFTAGLFHLMVDHQLHTLRPLRQLLAGGDVLSPAHAARLLRAWPHCTVINGYGPTENTTFTCCHAITLADTETPSIPIGHPISGTTVHILDQDHQPVPDGAVGQLCTGGLGLALEYLNRPDLTAERFVPDPFCPGETIYLTGDLAQRRADGAIMFLGRMDQQVKINGRRVELDEIAHILREQPGVQDAVVITRDDTPGQKRIVAYVVGSTEGLTQRLRALLPDWSIPSAIVSFPELPLTRNGKIDRTRLPPPDRPPSLAPRNALEQSLAAVLARVLGLASIGRNDNFFDLGATSLQLMDAHAEMTRTIVPNLSLLQLFAAPTIAQLAASLTQIPTPVITGSAERARRAADALRQARGRHIA